MKPFSSLVNRSLFIAVMASTHSLNAQTQWLPASGTNDYNTGTNWSSGNVPTTGGTAVFDTNGTQTVSLAASPAGSPTNMGRLTVGMTSGTLTFNSIGASGNVVISAANDIVLGTDSNANVVIQRTGGANFIFRSGGVFVVGGDNGKNNNTVTVQGANVTAASTASNIIVGFNNSSNNLLHVKNGAALSSIGGVIGRAGNSDNNTVRLSDADTTWTLSGNPASAGLTLGDVAGADNNNLIVENSALLRSTVELRVKRGTVHLNSATIDLTYGAGTDQALVFQAAGRLRGQGELKASGVSSSAVGAIVEIGEETFGVIDTELTGAGWDNTNIKLELGVGDITGSAVAGTNYDLLDITGSFTFGGTLEIDLAEAVLSSVYDFALIKWTSFAGNIEGLDVSFINGSALNYEVRSDGFYVYAVPEPSVVSLLLGVSGMLVVGVYHRSKRS